MPGRALLSLCLVVSAAGWWPAASPAAPRSPAPGMRAPHDLPARGAAASAAEPRTWIVGARAGASALAQRYGARSISGRGIYVVDRGRTREFVHALRRARAYTFSEPNRRVRATQAPAPIDDYAATDWRAFLIPPSLTPPPLEQAPLSAVIDSAPDVTHPDLAGVQVVGNSAIVDLHGTAVASVLAGRANGAGMVGVYPGAPVLAIGSGLDFASITSAIAAATEAKAKVINLSLGSPVPSYAMFVELAYAVSQGAIPVAAAGNDFGTVLTDGTRNPVEFPAAFPHVLSVASIGPSGASSAFSTANGAVDLSAPGESVLTAVPVAFDDDGTPDGYERLDGTSFASPIVAGAAAWLIAARPDLGGGQIADALRWSATDADVRGWDSNTGFGVLNLAGALTEPDPPADTVEVNDDVEWVNGTRFTRADPYIFRTFSRTRYVSGSVDTWKDPADVYRIELARHANVDVTLRPASRRDPDLAVYRSRATTIYKRRDRIAFSYRAAGRTESIRLSNRGPRTVAYVAVYAPTPKARFLDAPYALTVRRAHR